VVSEAASGRCSRGQGEAMTSSLKFAGVSRCDLPLILAEKAKSLLLIDGGPSISVYLPRQRKNQITHS
jgi:hypothetical protein